jgi:predicted transcriptional regulator
MAGPDGSKTSKVRGDGRRQFLVHVSPDVIKEVKKVAVDDDVTASAITEKALRQWLSRRASRLAAKSKLAEGEI